MIKLSDYVMRFIKGLKVDCVFLLPGGGCMHLVDSLGRSGLRYVANLHEQAAVIGADGYSQYTGNIGVALVTTGPGGTNAITGVAGAWIDSTPLIVLSGQAKRADMLGKSGLRQKGIQEVDIISLVKPITKYAATVIEPESVRFHLEKASYLAKSGRPGPVWVEFPLDVQAGKINVSKLKGFNPPSKNKPPLSNKINRIVNLLNHSKRPVILAGKGIRLAKAEREFNRLIEALGIPVLTTWRGMDLIPENHPLFFGRPGAIASRGANFIQQNADLIITIGARLDLPQVGHSYANFARGAKKVIVDIDPAEIKKIGAGIDVPVAADALLFIKAFLHKLGSVKLNDRSDWLKRCAEWKEKYPVLLKEYLKPGKYVNAYALIETLSQLMAADDLLVPGSSGSCAELTPQAFKLKHGQRYLNSPGLGSMGYGLPQSIGACLASGRRTICLIGDGGLQHNIQELETLQRLKLPLKLFILNNNGYASIRNTHKRFFDGRLVACDSSSGLTVPPVGKVALAYGLKAVKINNQRKLRAEIKKVLETAGPVVCEVMIDPDQPTAPRLSSAALPGGKMVSKPLEDLWPFLEREEFRRNMIIEPLNE